MGFLSRRLIPRTVRRATHPVRTVKRAVTPKPVKQVRRALHPIDNAVYGVTLSIGTKSSKRRKSGGKGNPIVALLVLIFVVWVLVLELWHAAGFDNVAPTTTTTTTTRTTTTTVPLRAKLIYEARGPGSGNSIFGPSSLSLPNLNIKTAPWRLNWTYNCSRLSDGPFVFFIIDVTQGLDEFGPTVMGYSGSGSDRYNDKGTFGLSVETQCRWWMQVFELLPAKPAAAQT